MSEIFKVIVKSIITSACPYSSCAECKRQYQDIVHRIDPECAEDPAICNMFDGIRDRLTANLGTDNSWETQREIVNRLFAAILKRQEDGGDLNITMDQIVDMLNSL